MGSANCTTVAGQPNGSRYTPSNSLYYPFDAVTDIDGNIYIADSAAHRISFWNNGASSGTTIAGTVCKFKVQWKSSNMNYQSLQFLLEIKVIS